MEYRIREATWANHDTCCAIMKQYDYTSAYSHMFYSSKERYKRGDILVALSGRMIVGVACVSYRTRKYKGRPPAANVQYIAVDDAWRGSGVGRALIEAAQERHPDHRVELKVEERNKDARKAYRKMGFKNTLRFRSDEGRDYVVMTKEKATD